MLFDAKVDIVVLREDGVGKYSVLLCDLDGSNRWILPFGDILEIENESEFDLDDNEVFNLSCFSHLENICGIVPEMIDDMEIHPYKHYRVKRMAEMEHDYIVFGYWCMLDKEKHAAVEKILEPRKGNVAFFPFSDKGKSGLPELADSVQARFIEEVMSHFYKRDN